MATQTVEDSSRSGPRRTIIGEIIEFGIWESSPWLGNYSFDGCCDGSICEIFVYYFADL